jgi:hypothetical protein
VLAHGQTRQWRSRRLAAAARQNQQDGQEEEARPEPPGSGCFQISNHRSQLTRGSRRFGRAAGRWVGTACPKGSSDPLKYAAGTLWMRAVSAPGGPGAGGTGSSIRPSGRGPMAFAPPSPDGSHHAGRSARLPGRATAGRWTQPPGPSRRPPGLPGSILHRAHDRRRPPCDPHCPDPAHAAGRAAGSVLLRSSSDHPDLPDQAPHGSGEAGRPATTSRP